MKVLHKFPTYWRFAKETVTIPQIKKKEEKIDRKVPGYKDFRTTSPSVYLFNVMQGTDRYHFSVFDKTRLRSESTASALGT